AYMAPEQAAGQALSPASDWYAVGVMLFEALVGRLPFTGSAWDVLSDKQEREPPSVTGQAPLAPADLAALRAELLRQSPAARPPGEQVLQRLEALPDGSCAPRVAAVVPFLGRTAHLRALGDALAAVSQGGPRVLCVHGPSGVGKSALVRHFLDGLTGRGAT